MKQILYKFMWTNWGRGGGNRVKQYTYHLMKLLLLWLMQRKRKSNGSTETCFLVLILQYSKQIKRMHFIIVFLVKKLLKTKIYEVERNDKMKKASYYLKRPHVCIITIPSNLSNSPLMQIIWQQIILFLINYQLTTDFSQTAAADFADLGKICRISTSGSLISAAIREFACFVASSEPLRK